MGNERFPKYEVLDEDKIRTILKKYTTVAVVGLSSDSFRPSYRVANYLKDKNYRIIPVNPNYQEILGEKCYPSLSEVPEKVEIVDIFRKPEYILSMVEEAIKIGVKVVWMQAGIINYEAADKACQNGVEVVMDRCMMREHMRLSEE